MIIEGITKNQTSNRLLSISLFLLVIDALWGFMYTSTVFSTKVMEYISIITLLVMFLVVFFRYERKKSKIQIIWTPYLLMCVGSSLFQLSLQYFTQWLICYIIILIAARNRFLESIPYNLLLYSAMIALVGTFIQIFLPDFHADKIRSIFLAENMIEEWSEGYGFSGFTPQLGTNSIILILGELFFINLKDIDGRTKIYSNYIYNAILIAFVVGVLLTGKRTIAISALVIPLIIYFLRIPKFVYKFVYSVVIILLIAIIIAFFIDNIQLFENSLLFGRFAHTYNVASYGGDITSGRTGLYNAALKAFNDQPVFGIGLNQFRTYTHIDTLPHNTYLQVLCEQGIIGFIAYILPIIYCLAKTISLCSKRMDKHVMGLVCLSLSIQFFFYSLCFHW